MCVCIGLQKRKGVSLEKFRNFYSTILVDIMMLLNKKVNRQTVRMYIDMLFNKLLLYKKFIIAPENKIDRKPEYFYKKKQPSSAENQGF